MAGAPAATDRPLTEPPAVGTDVVDPHPTAPSTTTEPAEAAEVRRPGSRSAAIVVSAAAVLVLAAAVVSGAFAWSSDARESDGRAAVAAADQVAVDLTSIKADTADADMQRLLDNATGGFRDQFEQRRGPFVQIVQQAKVSTTGSVVIAGLDRLDGDTARVLVAVHSTVSNVSAQKGEPRDYRLAITVQHVNSTWLASDVQFVA